MTNDCKMERKYFAVALQAGGHKPNVMFQNNSQVRNKARYVLMSACVHKTLAGMILNNQKPPGNHRNALHRPVRSAGISCRWDRVPQHGRNRDDPLRLLQPRRRECILRVKLVVPVSLVLPEQQATREFMVPPRMRVM
jgi:hypothetical protein